MDGKCEAFNWDYKCWAKFCLVTSTSLSENKFQIFLWEKKMTGLHAFTVHLKKKGFTLWFFCIVLSRLLIIFVISD